MDFFRFTLRLSIASLKQQYKINTIGLLNFLISIFILKVLSLLGASIKTFNFESIENLKVISINFGQNPLELSTIICDNKYAKIELVLVTNLCGELSHLAVKTLFRPC